MGIRIGIVVHSITCIKSECMPLYKRSLSLNGIWFLYPVGIIYICVLSMNYINFEKNMLNWKKIAL